MAGKTLYQKYAASLPVLPQNRKILFCPPASGICDCRFWIADLRLDADVQICNLQSAICNLQSAICNLQSAIQNPKSHIALPLAGAVVSASGRLTSSARQPHSVYRLGRDGTQSTLCYCRSCQDGFVTSYRISRKRKSPNKPMRTLSLPLPATSGIVVKPPFRLRLPTFCATIP